MADIVALDPTRHRGLRRQPTPVPTRFVRVALQEVALLADRCPLLFAKDAETGAFFLGAMRGIDPGEDLLAGEDEGMPHRHQPLEWQRAPFLAMSDGLAVDLASPLVGWEPGSGDALFDADGQPTAALRAAADALAAMRHGLEAARQFIDRLLAERLIEPVDIALGFDDGSRRELEGLYTIDQDRLRALPPDVVVDLFGRGYLQLAYLVIWSLRRVPDLAQRKNRQLAAADPAFPG